MKYILLMMLWITISTAPSYGQNARLTELATLPPYALLALDEHLEDSFTEVFGERNNLLNDEALDILRAPNNLPNVFLHDEWVDFHDQERDARISFFDSVATDALSIITNTDLSPARAAMLEAEVPLFVRTVGAQQAGFHVLMKAMPLARLRDRLTMYRRFYTERTDQLATLRETTEGRAKSSHAQAKRDRDLLLQRCQEAIQGLNGARDDMEDYLDDMVKSEEEQARAQGEIDSLVSDINQFLDAFTRSGGLMNSLEYEANGESILITIFNQHHQATSDFVLEFSSNRANNEFDNDIGVAEGIAGRAGADGDQEDLEFYVTESEKILRVHLQSFQAAYNAFLDAQDGIYLGGTSSDMIEKLLEPRAWSDWASRMSSSCNMPAFLTQFMDRAEDNWPDRLSSIQDEEVRRNIEDILDRGVSRIRNAVNQARSVADELQELAQLNHRRALEGRLPR